MGRCCPNPLGSGPVLSLPPAQHKAPTWHDDARGQALQHAPQGLTGTHGPVGGADRLLAQELQGLQGKEASQKLSAGTAWASLRCTRVCMCLMCLFVPTGALCRTCTWDTRLCVYVHACAHTHCFPAGA